MRPEILLFNLISTEHSLNINEVFNNVHCTRNWEFSDKQDRLRPSSHGTCELSSRRNRLNNQINTLFHHCRQDYVLHGKATVIVSSWVLRGLTFSWASVIPFLKALVALSERVSTSCKMLRITWERWWQLRVETGGSDSSWNIFVELVSCQHKRPRLTEIQLSRLHANSNYLLQWFIHYYV